MSVSRAAKEAAAAATDAPLLSDEAVGEVFDRLAACMPGRPAERRPDAGAGAAGAASYGKGDAVTTGSGKRAGSREDVSARIGSERAAATPKGRKDPFRSCISCMLSAQSRDANTARATANLFRLARTPRTMLKLDDETIANAIRPAGLYNMKARNIRKFCTALLEEHGGVVPTTREGLMSLPGIGRKCADIVLHFTFGVDVIAVDTHVHRVCNRTGLARGKTEAQTARALEARAPARAMRDGHVRLLQFGKTVCPSRAPRCPSCPIRDLCLWPDKREA